MSVQMFGAVILCGPRDRTQYCVMSALANNADDFGFAFPAIATIAADSRCDDKTVKRALKALVDEGWLYIARKIINGKGNCYILNVARLGVRVSPDSRRSPVFTRLLKLHGDTMTPIFAPEKSEGMDTFSGDNPQPVQRTWERSQGTFEVGSEGIACPPNRNNRKSLNRKGTVSELEPPTLPAQAGDAEDAGTLPEQTAERGHAPEHADLPAAELSQTVLEAWRRVKEALKREVGTMRHRNFSELRPGESDWDVCFRDWWLRGIRRQGLLWIFETESPGVEPAVLGVQKYHARLDRTVRAYFPIPAGHSVTFSVAQAATANLDPAA